jgi:alkylated DNA repair dioxygenase AlkB
VQTHALLFPLPGTPPRARQAILNFYRPGEGITPHVDLLDRFGDGIIGVSLGSGCVMRFRRIASTEHDAEHGSAKSTYHSDAAKDVFLPPGSIYVMSEEARYGWTHGIDGRREDWVQDQVESATGRWVMRSIRVSITFRWLLPGADVVGGLADPETHY